jgi:predicted O-methyltransferase YrrM
MTKNKQSWLVDESFLAYFRAHYVAHNPLLERLREDTRILRGFVMQVTPEVGAFLGFLVKLTGASKILEVGTFTGYSTLSMALALEGDGEITSIDVEGDHVPMAAAYFNESGVGHRIHQRIGSADQMLAKIIRTDGTGIYDMIFVDADKLNTDLYYEYALQLIRPGGLVILDNILWKGKVANLNDVDPITTVFRSLQQKAMKDDRVAVISLPLHDGMMFLRKKDDANREGAP